MKSFTLKGVSLLSGSQTVAGEGLNMGISSSAAESDGESRGFSFGDEE